MNNDQIKGIPIRNKINLLTQFADDTTLSLDGSEQSLKEALNTITEFSLWSGLKINESKTMIIWIGSMKGNNTKYLRDRNYIWDPGTSFKIVGIYFSTNIDSIPKLNYDSKLLEMRKIIHKWKKRQITPFGKIAIIKSLVISKITHLLLNLPDPDENFLKDLEKELFSFLWGDKTSKISKKTICNEYPEGGIRMVNIRNLLTSLKISWIRKSKNDESIQTILNDAVPGLLNVTNFGVIYSKNLKEQTRNPFWKDVLTHFISFHLKCKPMKIEDFMTDHIFYNDNFRRGSEHIYIKEWVDHGIFFVHNLCQDDGSTFMSHDEFKRKYDWCNMDYLTYIGIINTIRNTLRPYNLNDYSPNKLTNKLCMIISKGNKFVQKYLNSSHGNPSAVNKWNTKFDNIDWCKSFNLLYLTTKDVQLRWFQFRLLHRIIPTQKYLYITKIVGDPVCNFCQEEEQDICHLFFECVVTLEFWRKFEQLFKQKCIHCQNVKFDKELIIFGNKKNFISDTVFNWLILFAKFFVYKCKLGDNYPTLERFLIMLKHRYKLEKFLASTQENSLKFDQNWLLYTDLVT